VKAQGTATLVGNYWVVEAPPHVLLRLRRLFAAISKKEFGSVKLKATDEVSRDLLWFTARFPLEVRPLSELKKRARRYDKSSAAFTGLVTGDIAPRDFAELALPPRDYQRIAGTLLLEARGLLLADDLGVGKTASVFCALTDPRTRPALVVTLTHLPVQWQRELARFMPSLRTHVIKSGMPYDVCEDGTMPDVVIMNYHKLAGWAETLAGVVKSVTFDEVQELRKLGTKKHEAARHLSAHAHFLWGLSATPIYNYGGEFWNVLSILRPDDVGTREEFLREWCHSASTRREEDKASVDEPRAFGTYLRSAGLMLRRTRAEVGRELPGIQHIVQYCDASRAALEEAEDAASELARILLSKESTWEQRGQAAREIDWRLRQATGIAKAPAVAAFVRLLVESGERVVLYGWHRAVYDVWCERLKDLKPVMFTGSESTVAKEKARVEFCEGRSPVLIMSLRAGAGLDGLQYRCRTVVNGELDWSPGVHEQGAGRVFRDGQPDPVAVYYLVSEAGSDPVVSDVLGLKRGQIEGVRDPTIDVIEKLAPSKEGIPMLAERYLKHRQRGRDTHFPSEECIA